MTTRQADALTVDIGECGFHDGCLYLQYSAAPVPAILVGDRTLREGSEAGIAIVRPGSPVRDCRTAYRTSSSGAWVRGAVVVGPAPWPDRGTVQVLFALFAHTPTARSSLCRVQLAIDGHRVRRTAKPALRLASAK